MHSRVVTDPQNFVHLRPSAEEKMRLHRSGKISYQGAEADPGPTFLRRVIDEKNAHGGE